MEKKNPIATIQMNSGNKIVIELYPEYAPNTVNNFIYLVNKGYYNGLTFHRVVPGYIIQGGCPLGTGGGHPGYYIKGEFPDNGFPNPLKHERGVLSSSRYDDPNSAESQIFIMVETTPRLDGQYAAFGRVIEGMDEVDAIANQPFGARHKPLVDQVMNKVTVETFGVDYPEPERLPYVFYPEWD